MDYKKTLKPYITILFISGILGLFLFPALCDGKIEEIRQNHLKLYQNKTVLDVSKILALSSIEKGIIIEVTVSYNMIRSNLEADFLYNGQVIGHTSMPKGMKKSIRLAYNRQIPGKIAVRFTGHTGQVQVSSVSALVDKIGKEEKLTEEGETDKKKKYELLSKIIKINPATKRRNYKLAQMVKESIIKKLIAQNLMDDEIIHSNISEDNSISIFSDGKNVIISGQIKSKQSKENVTKNLSKAVEEAVDVKSIRTDIHVIVPPVYTILPFVPNVIGKSRKAAEETIEKSGFAYSVELWTAYKGEYQGQEGKVVNQLPKAGKQMPKGSDVKITVYSPPEIEDEPPDAGLDLWVSASLDPKPTDPYSIQIKIFKEGTIEITNPILLRWELMHNNSRYYDKIVNFQPQDLNMIEDGECVSSEITIPPEKLAHRKNLKVVFTLDLGNQLTETDEDNNTYSLPLPDPPTIDLWASAINNYTVVDISVMQTGEPIVKPVLVIWQLIDRYENTIYSNETIFQPADFLEGEIKYAKEKIVFSPMYYRVSCKFKLTVDSKNEIQEWNEGNNSYVISLGDCESPPETSDPSILTDLIPEYSPDDLAAPDEEGNRRLLFKIANHGPGELRTPIKYSIEIKKNDSTVLMGGKELKPWELPIKPGEKKLIDPDFVVSQERYAIATNVKIIVDSEYQVAETNKLNNIAIFPFGLGEEEPEPDPSAKPDLLAGLSTIRVFTKDNCEGEQRKRIGSSCYAQIPGTIKNEGNVAAPHEEEDIDLELSILGSQGEEIFLNRKTWNNGKIEPDNSVALLFEAMPIFIFDKACQLRFTVDPDNKISELNEDNNVFVQNLEFCGQDPPLPDLKISEINVLRNNLDQMYIFRVEYKNIGNDGIHKPISITWTIDGIEYQSIDEENTEPFSKGLAVMKIQIGIFPPVEKSILVRVKINDGKATEQVGEIRYDNNVMDSVLELPQR